MPEHYCQATGDFGYRVEFDEEECCGNIARFTLWGVWFCATHYDMFYPIYESEEESKGLGYGDINVPYYTTEDEDD